VAAALVEPRRAHRHALDLGQRVLVASAGLVVVWGVTQTAIDGVSYVNAALAFGALIAFGELLRLNLPGDREVAPIATAGAMAYALLLRIGNTTATHGAQQVVAVTAVGMIVGALPHLAAGRPARVSAMSVRLLEVAVVAAVFRPLANAGLVYGRWSEVLVMLGLVICAWLAAAVVSALISRHVPRTRFGVQQLRDELRVQLPIGAATAASALLIVFAAEVMGLAAVAVFAAPLLVTQVALRRYAGISTTYLQAVRALARVTEIGGYVETGHSVRVSRLAVAIGRDLGMAEAELQELEYAALMHDIGQLSLRDPVPGGATVLVTREEQRRIAEYGAEVIQQAQVLDSVADIVRRQSDPCQPADRSEPPPLSSRIIRVANAYDDLVGNSADTQRAAAAMEWLHVDTGGEYDSRVVEALGRLVVQ
jgi:hypothetical protein